MADRQSLRSSEKTLYQSSAVEVKLLLEVCAPTVQFTLGSGWRWLVISGMWLQKYAEAEEPSSGDSFRGNQDLNFQVKSFCNWLLIEQITRKNNFRINLSSTESYFQSENRLRINSSKFWTMLPILNLSIRQKHIEFIWTVDDFNLLSNLSKFKFYCPSRQLVWSEFLFQNLQLKKT